MINAASVLPGFETSERLANNETVQILNAYHTTDDSLVYVEGFKLKSKPEEPYYSFGWRTNYSLQQAVELLDNAHELPGVNIEDGHLCVCTEQEDYEYEWEANLTDSGYGFLEKELGSVVLDKACLVRLDVVNLGAIVWESGIVFDEGAAIGIITSDPIESDWIKELHTKTADEKSSDIITKHIGGLAVCIKEFVEAPFGVCSLDVGFAKEN